MAFCNIQIGGSVFKNLETRSKQFTASNRDNTKPLRTAREWARAHDNMYEDIIRFLTDCGAETKKIDAARIRHEEGMPEEYPGQFLAAGLPDRTP